MCEDSCTYSREGICQDGGIGSVNGLCVLGDDCFDCSPRLDRSSLQNFSTLLEASEALFDEEGVLWGGLLIIGTELMSLEGLEKLTRVVGELVVKDNSVGRAFGLRLGSGLGPDGTDGTRTRGLILYQSPGRWGESN